MPEVDSFFLNKKGDILRLSCCAFLFHTRSEEKKIVVYNTMLKVSEELYEWWINFLTNIGLEIVSCEKVKIHNKSQSQITIEDQLFATGYGYPRNTRLYLLEAETGAWYYVTDGESQKLLSARELYVIRDGEKYNVRKLRDKNSPAYVVTYKCYRGNPQNLIIHTALRYGWHPQAKIVIEKCKEFMDSGINLSPYQILVLAHAYLTPRDPDILILNTSIKIKKQDDFMASLQQCHTVQGCFTRIGWADIATIKKAQELLKEEKFEEYIALLEM